MPSAKYSFSGSGLMFENGSTAIEASGEVEAAVERRTRVRRRPATLKQLPGWRLPALPSAPRPASPERATALRT